MIQLLLIVAVTLQGAAVAYAVILLRNHRGAAGAWTFLLGAMLSMLVWRVGTLAGFQPPPWYNPAIAIWGSVCMFAAMFLFGREVTRRERAETDRDRLLTSERLARSEAERASRVKDEFLATVSHELRTPLAAILGWCRILTMTDDRSTLLKAGETIERNARVQARLVDDLLDVSRLRAGSLHLERAPVELDLPVRAAVEGVQPAADAKQIAIELSVGGAPVVMGDSGRLQQVASNLLVNAVKFTPAGGRIRVTVAPSGHWVRLVVADDGSGIDPVFLPSLFTRFRQADAGTTREHGGLGIGLSIAASLVRLHDGEIEAASEGVGRGATFTVTLPMATAAERRMAVEPGGPVPVTDGFRPLAGIRVLLVDDETDVREAVSTLLEQSGAEVLALDSGATIEPAIGSFRPAVLVLDIGMPREDGYSLIQRVRRLPRGAGSELPAISLTAHARDEDRAHAMASGFQLHLPKPVDLPGLVAAIRQLVATRDPPAISA